MSESTAIIVPEVERVAVEAGISPDGVIALRDAFAPHFQAFRELAAEASTVGQDEPKRARELRLKVRAVRIAADKTRVEAKADALRRGKAIDGINNVLLLSLVPVEEGLERIEKAEEIRAAQRREALKQARTAEVSPFADPAFYDLAGMPDAQYADLLAGLKAAKAAHEAKLAEQKAEAERIEKANAERRIAEEAERKRMAEENARLAEIAAKERAAREETERKAAAERAEAARLAKIEADKRDAAERQRREKERNEREEAEAKAKAAIAKERAERERIQAEIAAREKVEADRIAREEAEARRAAAAPDADKVRALADTLAGIELPALNDTATASKIREQFVAMASWLRKTADKIGA